MERSEFTFTGLQIKQNPENSEITMDQNKYISSIDEVGEIRKENDEVKLNRQELRDFRGIVGQLSWAQLTTRPDLTYDALEMSTKNQSATIGDMKRLKKVVNKAKNPDNNISIKYRKLGHFKKLHIEGFSDASYPTNFDENIRDVAGSVVLLCNDEGLCSPLHWKGKTITKTCSNVKAAELHALQSAIDDSVYLARTIHELYTGEENGQLPVDMYIDSDGLKENIQSTKQIEEKRKRRDVANIKKMIVDGEVRSVSWMKGKEMLADCLTKRDANPGRLRDLLRSGINPNIRQKNIVYFCNLENSED